jgi:serine/threonine protein kinase/WD40 repeat protein
MNSPPPGRDPVEQLAEEFLDRYRRGERPSLSEYTLRYPELADDVRRLFPALVLMEELGGTVGQGFERSIPGGLTRLGEYRILREVGRGGMGLVFKAVQEPLGRQVALKVLPPALCRDKYLERFRREAKAAARLHHTNIVPVFGVGADAGMHFYVMQFIDGRGLDRVVHEVRRLRAGTPGQSTELPPGERDVSSLALSLLSGHFSPDTLRAAPDGLADTVVLAAGPPTIPALGDLYYQAVARLGLQAAEAFHYAHTQGVLHRDVKPSNLLLDAGGTVWVTDFGLAKADDFDDLTDSGDLVGTVRYMAPEQLQGRCDARSDVYGLGVTLFELLALRPAFDSPGRLRLMDQVAREAAPPLRQLAPQVPHDLETVVSKAMAREAADRYASARELADDLGRFLSDRPVQARRITAAERVGRWCRRHPGVAALSATVVVLLVAGAVGGWWAAARLGRQVEAVTSAERDTTERLWEARLAQAKAGRASRLPGQRFKSLEAIKEAARIRPSLELRNEAIACLALADVRVEREWDADLETDRLTLSTGVAFDPTLEHHASTSLDGTVRIQATMDGRLVASLPGPGGPADFLRFSPDGHYLAIRYTLPEHPCRVWDWQAGKVVFERSQPYQFTLAMDFRSDSRSLILGERQGLETIALPSGQTLATTRLGIAPGWVAVAPGQGDLVAVCSRAEPAQLQVVHPPSGRVIAAWDQLPTQLVAIAWHPDGKRLAASGSDGNLYCFDLGSGRPPAVLRGHLLEARELAFSPDGRLLVSRGWDGTTRLWDPQGEHEVLRIRGASFLQFDRDGRRLAYRGYNSRRLGIWELADQSLCRMLYAYRGRDPQRHAGVSFSPDSRLLATSAGEDVCLWDPRTGGLLERIHAGPTADVLFDPRGQYLYTTGDRGTLAWALARLEDANGVLWRVERPKWLAGPFAWLNGFQLDADRNGDRLAVVQRFQRVVLCPRPGQPGRRISLQEHPQVSAAALSPDGRYVATGTWRGAGVKVWAADSGQLVGDLPSAGSAGVAFTPDGSRLLVLESEGTYRSYRVGTWECEWERREPDTGFTSRLRAAFDPAGRIMAQVSDRVNLRLVGLNTGKELAVLQVPESQNLSGYQFSPNGRYLAATAVRGAVQLWDLRRLRATLQELGLDWDPPAPANEPEPGGATLLQAAPSAPPGAGLSWRNQAS